MDEAYRSIRFLESQKILYPKRILMMLRLVRLKEWCFEESGSVGRAAALLAIASILSRLLGVLRDRLLATTFGAGMQLDAYYAAFRLPDTLYNLIILGALSAGFLPVFAELKEKKGREEAFAFASQVFGWFACALIVLAVVGIVFAETLVPLIMHGFGGERLDLTVKLTRILFLSPVLLGVSAVFGGVLQSMRKTLVFAFAPVWYNVGILLGIILLTPWLGVMGVAIGVLVGAFFHVMTQGIGAQRLGLAWPTQLRFTPELKRLLVLTGPRLAALGASQVSLVVMLSFASTLQTGSVAVFQLGNNLQSFPLGVVGISFAVAAFPLLSEAAGKGAFDVYHDTLGKTGRRILFFLLPLSLLFILLRAQLVRLILGDGQFDWTATIATAEVVGWLSVSLVAQALIPLLARAFYALQSTWTPFLVTMIGESFTIGLAWQLKGVYGVRGLAIAFSAASAIQLMCLWMALRRRVGARFQAMFIAMSVRSFAACVPALAVAWAVRQTIGTVFPLRTFWQVALQFSVAMASAGVVYLVMMHLMKTEESRELVDRVKRLVS